MTNEERRAYWQEIAESPFSDPDEIQAAQRRLKQMEEVISPVVADSPTTNDEVAVDIFKFGLAGRGSSHDWFEQARAREPRNPGYSLDAEKQYDLRQQEMTEQREKEENERAKARAVAAEAAAKEAAEREVKTPPEPAEITSTAPEPVDPVWQRMKIERAIERVRAEEKARAWQAMERSQELWNLSMGLPRNFKAGEDAGDKERGY